MINVTVLSQRDARWAWKELGFSKATIGGYGCLITCIAMASKVNDVSKVNDTMKALGNYSPTNGKGAFLDSLVVWGNVPNAIKNLKFIERGWKYDNTKVRDHIAKGFPVIVQVPGDPIGAPRIDHYVLYLGDQKLADPWTGRIRSTSDFPNPKGFGLYEVKALELTDAQKIQKIKDIINSGISDTDFRIKTRGILGV